MYYVGGRIRFRHIEASLKDAYKVTRWRNTDTAQASFFSDDVVTPDTHLLFVKNRKPHDLVFMAEAVAGDIAIGMTSLTVDVKQRTGEYGRTYIDKDWRGQGYATETEYLLLSYAFDLLRLNSLWCDMYVSNKAVIALHLKTGWQKAGIDLLDHTDLRGPVLHQVYQRAWWEKHRETFIEQFKVRLPEWT